LAAHRQNVNVLLVATTCNYSVVEFLISINGNLLSCLYTSVQLHI